MTKQEILTKAIEKAVEGGYKPRFSHYFLQEDINENYVRYQSYCLGGEALKAAMCTRPMNGLRPVPEEIIFSHDFLKAFFGEDTERVFSHFQEYDAGDGYIDERNVYDEIIAWQYHAQQMVISEDPIGYLSKFV